VVTKIKTNFNHLIEPEVLHLILVRILVAGLVSSLLRDKAFSSNIIQLVVIPSWAIYTVATGLSPICPTMPTRTRIHLKSKTSYVLLGDPKYLILMTNNEANT
jgi:hypothetical protein